MVGLKINAFIKNVLDIHSLSVISGPLTFSASSSDTCAVFAYFITVEVD